MKQYKFDYIREWVEKWNPNIPKTVEQMEHLPWDVLLPWAGVSAKDHYGDEIEDLGEWLRQRDEYIRNLAKEYETLQNEGR